MSYTSWHTYGYGVCLSRLECDSMERMEKLLELAPEYHKSVQNWLREQCIAKPDVDDILESDQEYHLELQNVILEAENIQFTACDDYNSETYLVYEPSYPWNISEKERSLTEETLRRILAKYISILTDEVFEVDYCSVENGG
ncbi:MAG: hypothetical protein K2J67_06610 [Lachnospiraceae bacterium]|nr:hypothetical protein [Lachnospiraceae bacterium]